MNGVVTYEEVNAKYTNICLVAITMQAILFCTWILGLFGLGKFLNKKVHLFFKIF